jgi:hypothetical protein
MWWLHGPAHRLSVKILDLATDLSSRIADRTAGSEVDIRERGAQCELGRFDAVAVASGEHTITGTAALRCERQLIYFGWLYI